MNIETIVTNFKSNSSSGPDGLSSDILRTVAHNLFKPLSHVINWSFNTGIMPLDSKLPKIIPFQKSDDIKMLIIIDLFRFYHTFQILLTK